jgi:hypothetical protein
MDVCFFVKVNTVIYTSCFAICLGYVFIVLGVCFEKLVSISSCVGGSFFLKKKSMYSYLPIIDYSQLINCRGMYCTEYTVAYAAEFWKC